MPGAAEDGREGHLAVHSPCGEGGTNLRTREQAIVEIKPMGESFILWRCLHGGPLSKGTIDQWPEDQADNWGKHRATNVPLSTNLIEAYLARPNLLASAIGGVRYMRNTR